MKTTLNALHHQGADWQRELDFYIDELAILTKRLNEFTSSNSEKEDAAQSKHFLNDFMRLRKDIDALAYDIKFREEKIEKIAEDKPESIDELRKVANNKIFNNMKALGEGIATSRFKFYEFLINEK